MRRPRPSGLNIGRLAMTTRLEQEAGGTGWETDVGETALAEAVWAAQEEVASLGVVAPLAVVVAQPVARAAMASCGSSNWCRNQGSHRGWMSVRTSTM